MRTLRSKSSPDASPRGSGASDEEIAALVCDHSRIADCSLVLGVISSVRKGRRTPEEAVARLIELCPASDIDVTRALAALRAIQPSRASY